MPGISHLRFLKPFHTGNWHLPQQERYAEDIANRLQSAGKKSRKSKGGKKRRSMRRGRSIRGGSCGCGMK